MSVSVSTTAGTQVTVTVDGTTQLSFTTEESSISVVNGDTSSISVTNQGPKGDTGATGAKGDTGPQGPAGTSPNAFTTISVAGQDDVVADGVDDTLTIAGGSNVTVTTNASSDTITIASTDTNTNIYGADGALTGNRTVDLSSNSLTFDNGSNSTVAQITSVGDGIFTRGITVKGTSSGSGQLSLREDTDNGTNSVTIKSPANLASSPTFILPDSDGSANQVLKTDGSGNLSFVDQTTDTNTQLTTEQVQDIVGGMFTGNTETRIDVTYQDGDGTIDLVVDDMTATELANDSSPQLGGDLDVNGNSITSASNGDITIDPDGTGAIILKSDDIQFDGDGGVGTGKIKFYESDILGSNFIALAAPLSVTSDVTLYLPDGVGTSGQVLSTNGLSPATLSWADVISSSNPDFTGYLDIRSAGGNQGTLFLYDSDGSNYISFKVPSVVSSNVNFILPGADGSANQVLKTDGSGNLSFDEVGDVIGNRKFTKTSNTDADSNGDVVYFGGTTSMTAGALYMYTSFGTWALANANAASTCDGLLGIALGAASDTDGVLLRGMVTIDHDPGAVGDVLFASTTAGDITATAPSGSGDVVRIVGYCLDASNGQIWFNPDGAFVEVA